MQVISETAKPPRLPGGITEECHDFLKYCFIVDSAERVTIDELFTHPFVMFND